ncbi:MAG: hypothetical protein HPY52_14905 [Firmicutes bacterium]|nr:hypothetical protein [Bacillota bacterium]
MGELLNTMTEGIWPLQSLEAKAVFRADGEVYVLRTKKSFGSFDRILSLILRKPQRRDGLRAFTQNL